MLTDLASFGRFSVLLATLLPALAVQAGPDPKRLYQRALPSVMTLEVENAEGEKFIGSAVAAVANDMAITAWHVVSDARLVWATFADGTRLRVVGCIDKDWQRDLALLKLERPLRGRQAVLNVKLMPVASRVYVIGAPKGLGFSISDGLLSQVRTVDGFPQYQVSCPISPGNSGGPLLNEHGHVIGIVAWTKSDAQNVSFAVPCHEILRLNSQAAAVEWAATPLKSPGPTPQRKLDFSRPVAQTPFDSLSGTIGQIARPWPEPRTWGAKAEPPRQVPNASFALPVIVGRQR